MPLYKYRAKDGPENIIEGQIEAETEKEAIEKVHQLGYLPVRITKEIRETKSGLASASAFLGKIKLRDITIFSRQLASFMKSGMPILRALTIIAQQSQNLHLRNMLDSIRVKVRDGEKFSLALSNYPRVFPPLYIAMVRAGEDSGALQEVFLRIADHRQKQEEIISRVRMALVYPAVMATVAAGTILFMFTFVMPRLMKIFSNIGEDLPVVTKILISISKWLCLGWPWIISGIAVIFLIIRQGARTKAGETALSRFKLRLPFFGNLIRQTELARFSRTLELLLKNGIPILKAIKITIPVLNNEVLRQELMRSCKELEQGASFGKALKKSKLFPAFMSNLLIMGEESGRLEEALSEIAASYERETEEAVKVMTTLLEPLVILVMGIVIGFIVIAMLLPVFQINLMAQ